MSKIAIFRINGPDIVTDQISVTDKGLTVGRTPDNDLPLDNREISRRHVRIFWQDNQFWVEDLNSSNGAWLNDVRLRSPQPLEPGSRIRLGPFLLTLQRVIDALATLPTEDKPAPAPPPAPPAPVQEAKPAEEPKPADEEKKSAKRAKADQKEADEKPAAEKPAEKIAAPTVTADPQTPSIAATIPAEESPGLARGIAPAEKDTFEDAAKKALERAESAAEGLKETLAATLGVGSDQLAVIDKADDRWGKPPGTPPPTGLLEPQRVNGDPFGDPRRRSLWLQYLPEIYQNDDFIPRYLNIIESVITPIIWAIDNLDFYFTPELAPSEWLRWIASWFDILIIPELPIDRQRRIVQQIGWLFLRRGTKGALERLLELYFGVTPEIIEPKDDPCHFIVRLAMSESQVKLPRDTVDRLIVSQKPAFASYTLELT